MPKQPYCFTWMWDSHGNLARFCYTYQKWCDSCAPAVPHIKLHKK